MWTSDEQHITDVVAELAGRALLTESALSAILIHISSGISIAACLSSWATKQIDKKRRAFITLQNFGYAQAAMGAAWQKCRTDKVIRIEPDRITR